VTVSRIVTRSGVSRRTFYDLFDDREECFLAAFDESVRRVAAVVVPAWEGPRRWRERVRSALCSLLEFFDEEPGIARLLVVETLGGGTFALERRGKVIAQIVAGVERGREEARTEPLPVAGEGAVGAALALMHAHLLDPRRGRLLQLLNPLTSVVLLPYLGSAAARRELARPAPEPAERRRRGGLDPLRDLEMRLTYRTMRVLLAIGAEPHASNRAVAERSGIRDQGQVSKLLTRLEHLGLIENAGNVHSKGEPNAWSLTRRGADVREVIASQAA
jgi:AcrR family transcriptional regulator